MFDFSASHIPGSQNTAADALSRDNVTLFSSLFPQVPLLPPIPPLLLDLFLHRPPKWSYPEWIQLFRSSLTRDFRGPPDLHITGLRQYLRFCTMTNLPPFPLSEPSLCRFVAHLYTSGLQPGSARLYLIGILGS